MRRIAEILGRLGSEQAALQHLGPEVGRWVRREEAAVGEHEGQASHQPRFGVEAADLARLLAKGAIDPFQGAGGA